MKSEMSTRAKLLARHLSEKGIANLSQQQALEAVAHALNFKSYNEALSHERRTGAMKHKEGAVSATELLRQAVAAGLEKAEARAVFAERRSRIELLYVEEARGRYTTAGELEVDDDAEVSLSDDRGAYVQCWRWVSLDDLSPQDILDAFSLPYEKVWFSREGDEDESHVSLSLQDIEFNWPQIEQLREGKDLPADTWLVRDSAEGKEGALTLCVRHFRALHLKDERDDFDRTRHIEQIWEGTIDGEDWTLEFRAD